MHEESVLRAIGSTDRCILVAELPTHHRVAKSATRVTGWAQTWLNQDLQDSAPAWHYLAGVTVVPELRRNGVADALTKARLSWVAQRASEAFLVVNSHNLASIRLHSRWGFTEVLRAQQLTGVRFTGGEGILMRAKLEKQDSFESSSDD